MKPLYHCIFLLFVVELFFSCSHSLKCRGEDDEEDEDFNEVARMCMRNTSNWDRPSNNKNRYSTRNNDNNRKYGNHASNNGNGCGESNNNDNSWGGSRSNRNNNNYGSNSNSENNNNDNNRGRNSDSGNSWSYGGGWQQSPSNRGFTQYGGSDSYRNNENNSDRSRNNNHSMDFYGSSPLESIEPCIIHCIFSEMEMLDDEGLPEKTSVKNIMTRKIRNSEVRDFIEDSIEECYDLLDAENKREKCEYSKSLALCLEEKGRRTCEDWDAADRKNKNGR